MWRVGKAFLWTTAAMAGGLVVVALLPLERLDRAGAVVGDWQTWLTVARVAGIGALWFWWDRFAGWAGGGAAAVAYLRERRNFHCGCLVGVELVIVQNVAGDLWRWVG